VNEMIRRKSLSVLKEFVESFADERIAERIMKVKEVIESAGKNFSELESGIKLIWEFDFRRIVVEMVRKSKMVTKDLSQYGESLADDLEKGRLFREVVYPKISFVLGVICVVEFIAWFPVNGRRLCWFLKVE
jgi:hypothetical protein